MARRPGTEVIFVGTERGLEAKIVPAQGFRLLTIRSAGITGKRIVARLRGMAIIPVSMAQSLSLIGRTKPDLVIGVGGYSSGPVLASAVLRGVPTLIHEQNYVPGLTNRWLARYVKEVAVTFEETRQRLGGRGVVTGNPVRREFTLVGTKSPGDPVKHLLIVGGSQGARVINRAVCDALPALAPLGTRLRVTHQTGAGDHAWVAAAYASAGLGPDRAELVPFIAKTWEAFESADLVVSRCGSTTLAELTAAGRPSVLVPFAAATHDHQTFNALKLVSAGAAVMIAERELTGEKLAGTVIGLFEDARRLETMSVASRSLGRPDAAARIADLCEKLMSKGRAA